MADAYLNVAERVLLSARQPLRPREIIQRAYAEGLLPYHLYGPRQDKTLHARVSEDISRNLESSRFFRTSPGTFFLRAMLHDVEIPEAYRQIYFAPPRRKELRREHILTIELSEGAEPEGPFISMLGLNERFLAGHYAYRSFEQAMSSASIAAVHSFVLVFHDEHVLSYRSGKYTAATDPIYGMRSIGLGGAVYADDKDLLFESLHGIVASGIKELGYGVGLPRQLAERARYHQEVKPYLCSLLPGNSVRPAILQVVMGYECPQDFLPSKAALSVNDLRWVSVKNTANSLDDYDETSRKLYMFNEVSRLRSEVRQNAVY